MLNRRKLIVSVPVGCPTGKTCFCDGTCRDLPTRDERIAALRRELLKEEIQEGLYSSNIFVKDGDSR